MIDFSLPAHLGIEQAVAMHEEMLAFFTHEMVVIHADMVERVHAAGLQLLHAFISERAAMGYETVFDAASSALIDAAQNLGLCNSLGLGR